MTEHAVAEERLTIWKMLSEVGWLPLFLIGLGGFSVLAIVEQGVLREPLQLTSVLQWPLDGYHRLSRLIGAFVEPAIFPVSSWLSAKFHLSLRLDPVWRPLFLLAAILPASLVRNFDATLVFKSLFVLITGLGSLLGALIVGFSGAHMGWLAQGITAGVPTTLVGIAICVAGVHGDITEGLQQTALCVCGAFSVAAALSFAPGLSQSSGIVTLGVVVIVIAGLFLIEGLRHNIMQLARIGLVMSGGFGAAAIILAADAFLRTFT